jgi:hypothetical protein
MVGAAGIEPATPTMSMYRLPPKNRGTLRFSPVAYGRVRPERGVNIPHLHPKCTQMGAR